MLPTDEGWVDTLVFDVFTDELLQKLACQRRNEACQEQSIPCRAFERWSWVQSIQRRAVPTQRLVQNFAKQYCGTYLVQDFPQELVGFLGVQGFSRRESDVQLLF